jgi:hypothetical protein
VNDRSSGVEGKTLQDVAATLIVRDNVPATIANVSVMIAAAYIASALPTLNINQRSRLGAKRIIEEVFGNLVSDDSPLTVLSKRI